MYSTNEKRWVGCTVPVDPGMSFSVDACLLEMSQAFEIQPDRETHGIGSDFDYPGSVRHLHSEPSTSPCQVPCREILEEQRTGGSAVISSSSSPISSLIIVVHVIAGVGAYPGLSSGKNESANR